jgi:hypothetical protein
MIKVTTTSYGCTQHECKRRFQTSVLQDNNEISAMQNPSELRWVQKSICWCWWGDCFAVNILHQDYSIARTSLDKWRSGRVDKQCKSELNPKRCQEMLITRLLWMNKEGAGEMGAARTWNINVTTSCWDAQQGSHKKDTWSGRSLSFVRVPFYVMFALRLFFCHY